MNDVFFFEAFDEEADALRRHLPAGIRAGFTRRTIQEEALSHPPAKIISIRTQSVIPPAWAPLIDALITRSTGFDHARRYREQTGGTFACGYLPRYCARAVAEQAMLLWTALLRRLPLQVAQFDAFHRDGLTGRECAGKRLVVVGVGQIGSEVVAIGTGLGMEVLGVDVVRRHAAVDYATPEEAVPRADVLVCAMNLTKDNVRYFDHARFRSCRRKPVFVNIARGEMSPAEDLLRALDEGLLAGVGLDVYENEPTLAVSLRAGAAADDPAVRATLALRARKDVILTPHNAFNTAEAVERKAEQTVQQVRQFLADGTLVWPVPE